MRFVLASLSLVVVLGGAIVVEAYPVEAYPIESWVSQPKDHKVPAAGTFFQRYWMDHSYLQTGGPVFLFLGGEGPTGPGYFGCTFCSKYAATLGGACFILEHRYYGESSPEDLTNIDPLPEGVLTFPPGTFQYLSSEQALEDIRGFIKYAMGKYNLSSNKWVVVGGSYAGTLAAWARQSFPDLIYAAVASSAPLEARIDYSYFRRTENTRSSGLKLHGDPGPNGEAWWYQACTEFGWFMHYLPATDEQLVKSRCSQYPGVTVGTLQQAVDNVNKLHGGKSYFMERVIFVHGSEDVWRLAGITKSPNQEVMPVFVIHGAGHCSDVYSHPLIHQNEETSSQIVHTQNEILSKLMQWL